MALMPFVTWVARMMLAGKAFLRQSSPFLLNFEMLSWRGPPTESDFRPTPRTHPQNFRLGTGNADIGKIGAECASSMRHDFSFLDGLVSKPSVL